MKHLRRIDLNVGWADCELTDLVTIGDRLVPGTIDVTFPGAEGQPALTMTIDSTTGVPRCIEIRITAKPAGREVRTTDLRAVAIEDWLEAIVAEAAGMILIQADDGTVITGPWPVSGGERREAIDAIRSARRSARRRVTPELLQRVAEVYQQHQDERPVQAVMDAFGTSRRTASRYVHLARQQDLFPVRDGDVKHD